MAKQVSATGAVKASSLIVKLDALVAEREIFEREEYARSNAKLYEILSKVYAAYRQAKDADLILPETVKLMVLYLKQNYGERIQTNTPAVNLFVRYVFRSSRQRIHNYGRTLQAAYVKNIKPAALAQFIADGGGVEECKKDFVPGKKALARKAKIASAIDMVNEQITNKELCLAEVKVPAEWVEGTYEKEMTFLIGQADKNGKVRVTSVVPTFSQGMANWARTQLALFLAEQQAVSQQFAKENRKEAAIDAVAKKAKKKNSATETVGELLAA